ncbi:MAG: aspartate/glutamate racemase family protein [Rubrivivax sp.]|nr:aspartate/glutamate racemase family protein [Rubrivivax sp.]
MSGGGHLGVLMLDTRFPRLPGDVGHAASFRMPVRYAVVSGAAPRRVVGATDVSLLQPFIAVGLALVAGGARAITTSCGFLIRYQAALQAALPVPVWSSSLLKLAELARPGVLTVDAQALGAAELLAAGARTDIPIEGLRAGCAFQRTLLDDLASLNEADAQAELVAAAQRLQARDPQIDALVLECTNMPPYAAAVQAATGLPVHHLMTLVHERWPALSTP